jgi:uncharacterized protein
MSGLTLKPILGCNMGCVGCYEGDIFRANGNKPSPYDISAMVARYGDKDGPITLHGGEIGLMPTSDMRLLMEAASGRPLNMQTNGSLLRDSVLKLCQEFKVHIGVSLNGPGRLNRDRRAAPHQSLASDEATDKLTARIFANVEKARLQYDLGVSIITVLSKTNVGTDEDLDQCIEWAADWGERLGIPWWRWNTLHEEGEGSHVELSPDRAAEVYKRLVDATFADAKRLWNPFREFVGNLTGQNLQPCWMGPCDPYNTEAVYAVFGDGSVGNCLRTAKDGVPYLRSEDGIQHFRQEILQSIPMSDGGCGGCKWWKYCHGACPAEAVDGDWRNKTKFCKMYYDTYEHISERIRGVQPDWKRTER